VSRSDYSDDLDNWELIKWRGRVASALRGRRGRRLLSDFVAALDAMPRKELIAEDLVRDGEVCALGAVGMARGVALEGVDPYDHDELGRLFDIAPCLAQEIEYLNDEAASYDETPEHRWGRMRAWAATALETIAQPPLPKGGA
jgi:hypothetical protein